MDFNNLPGSYKIYNVIYIIRIFTKVLLTFYVSIVLLLLSQKLSVLALVIKNKIGYFFFHSSDPFMAPTDVVRDLEPDYPGYWGPPTATLDWCEANYDVTFYVAEFCKSYFSLLDKLTILGDEIGGTCIFIT